MHEFRNLKNKVLFLTKRRLYIAQLKNLLFQTLKGDLYWMTRQNTEAMDKTKEGWQHDPMERRDKQYNSSLYVPQPFKFPTFCILKCIQYIL